MKEKTIEQQQQLNSKVNLDKEITMDAFLKKIC